MRYSLLIFFIVLASFSFSDDFRTGTWEGKILLQDTVLHVELRIINQRDSFVFAVLSKPALILLEDSSFNGTELNLKVSKEKWKERNENIRKRELYQQKKTKLYYDAKFTGSLADNKNQLNGKLTLDDKVFPVTLFRDSIPLYRPQEPKRPFPYYSEDVVCQNPKDSTILAGTLTLPQKEGKFPVVIFQTGSFPSPRDGDGNHHKHTLVVADYLTRHGIGVLRYDDRGIGESKGNFFQSTPLDLSGDLIAWRDFLASREDIISSEIGIIGHSEGGMVAAMAASQRNDFNFIVLLATPGLKLRDVFENQIKLRLNNEEMNQKQYDDAQQANQKIYEMIDLNLDSKTMRDSLMKFNEAFIRNNFGSLEDNSMKRFNAETYFVYAIVWKTSPHNLFNLKVNPSDYFEKLTCPVLSLGGSLDRQVPSKENQEAIKQALVKAGNKNFQIIELEGLNHSFQECEKGTIKEAMKLEQTFSPKALEIMTNWILFHTKSSKN